MSSLILPEDIISNILSRLSVKSILRFRCVCKSWGRLFCNPNFIKLHLDHETEKENFSLMWTYQGKICSSDYNYEYSSSSLSSMLYNETVIVDCSVDTDLQRKFEIDYNAQLCKMRHWSYCSRDGFSIVNSCNGVVCLTAPGIVLLWNPSTKETRKIPRTTGHIGFGCGSEIGEFKMVELAKINPIKRKRRGGGIYSNYSEWEENLRVYSFESNSWKVIPKIPYRITSYDIIFFKEAFHWLARPCDGSKQVLVSFVMHDESFQEVLLPQHFYPDNLTSSVIKVCVLGGFLAVTYTLYNNRTEIWVFKDSGERNFWSELCSIDLRVICEHPVTCLTFIRSFKNDELLFQKYPPGQDGKHLFLYDPNHGKVRAVDIHGMPPQFQKYHISLSSYYIRTLASVGSNTSKEETQRKMTLRSWNKRHL